MIVNLVIGVVVWLVYKVLYNLIDQVFVFEYWVIGKWEDFKVVKVNIGCDINKEIVDEISKQNLLLFKDMFKDVFKEIECK